MFRWALFPLVFMAMQFMQPLQAAEGGVQHAGELPGENTLEFFGLRNPQIEGGIITVMKKPDLLMIERNNYFGYTKEQVEKWFSQEIPFQYDFRGFAPDSVKAPPKPGIHPRVFFGPEELPELRKRLMETVPGQKIMSAIRNGLEETIRGKHKQLYQDLIDGNATLSLADRNDRSVAYGTVYEAFRCLIEEDHEGGRQVAKAITNLAKIDYELFQQAIAQYKKENPDKKLIGFGGTTKGPSQEGTLGLAYDWAYQWMTPAQRDSVRKTIALATANMKSIGAEALRTPEACGTNWVSWNSRLVTLCAAIEGEEGYDHESYRRCVDAMQWFFALTLFPSGETKAGWGKQFLMADLAYIMARRGEPILATRNVVSGVFRRYWLHALDPWGAGKGDKGPFTFYDSAGGTGNNIPNIADVLVYKKLYPRDPYIDYIYRCAVGDDYRYYESVVNLHHPFSTYNGFCRAIFAGTYEESRTMEETRALVTSPAPLTYHCEDSGNMITRSSWDKDALYLYYLTRSYPGGHKYADRGHFNLYADGRHWAIYRTMLQRKEAYMAKMRGVLLIDGEGPSFAPGKAVAYKSQPLASFAASDFKITYDWISNKIIDYRKMGKKQVKFPYTFNDFRLTPSNRPSWNLTQYERPTMFSQKSEFSEEIHPSRGWRKQPVPMEKAFRTAGMIRGKHPYVLIIDDFKKDDELRHYQWCMTLADDVVLAEKHVETSAQTYRADAILGEKGNGSGSNRKLLVRMVRADGITADTSIGLEEAVAKKGRGHKDWKVNKLCFNAKSKEPRFVCLIMPINKGNPAPETFWNKDRSAFTLRWQDQEDTILLKVDNKGRSHPYLIRDGGKEMKLLD